MATDFGLGPRRCGITKHEDCYQMEALPFDRASGGVERAAISGLGSAKCGAYLGWKIHYSQVYENMV